MNDHLVLWIEPKYKKNASSAGYDIETINEGLDILINQFQAGLNFTSKICKNDGEILVSSKNILKLTTDRMRSR